MKAEIDVKTEFKPLTTAKLPSKKPFRVIGKLGVESLNVEVPKRELHKQFSTVPPAVPAMFSRLESIAKDLKALEESKAEMDKLPGGLESLNRHEVLEV